MFYNINGKLYGEHFNHYKRRPINRWLNSDDYLEDKELLRLMCRTSHEIYPLGWHIFLRKKDAKRWREDSPEPYRKDLVIRKVLFKEVVAKGEQIRCRVVVAKKIKILPLKKKICVFCRKTKEKKEDFKK